MTLPQGYTHFGAEIVPNQPKSMVRGRTKVCKLSKSLHGLKQAPRQWFAKLSSALLQFGFKQSKADYSLFVKNHEGKFLVVLIYVDDMIITGNSPQTLNDLKKYLHTQFHMKDLGDWKYFLGLEIKKSSQGLFVCQQKYTLDLLQETGMANCKPLKLPIAQRLKLLADSGTQLSYPNPYRRLVGKLIYLSITRPDITYAVHILSQFMTKPTTEHMEAANHLLCYLKSCPGQGILLTADSTSQVTGYCDSDWASCPMGRRSTTGYAVMLGNSLISWRAKKQDIVSRSSAKAEYRAMAMTCCDITWLVSLLQDLGFDKTQLLPFKLFCDNMAALHNAKNPVFHERTKHIEVDCHYVRDKLLAGIIKTAYIPTKVQPADVFTKAVSVDQFHQLLCKLGVMDPFHFTPNLTGSDKSNE